MSDLEKIVTILRNREMEIQFAFDPASGLIGEEQESRLLEIARTRGVEAKDVRLGLPIVHDEEDLETTVRVMQAPVPVTLDLAKQGLLTEDGKVIVEHYLVGMPFPKGEPQSFPHIRELRTRADYENLNMREFSDKTNPNYPNHHLVVFTVDDRNYYYWTLKGNYVVPIYLALRDFVIPLILGDDEKFAKALMSDNKAEKMEAYFFRVDHFARQLFTNNFGLHVMIAGDMDFVDPSGVEVYNTDRLYIQAVHKDFKNSRYIQIRKSKQK